MKFIISLIAFFLATTLCAQDPLRFQKDVDRIMTRDSGNVKKNPVIFTGSSSIGMWKDLDQAFPDQNVLNHGFGGSHMSDLMYYYPRLVVSFKPKMVFIYEGDNDIASGKSPETILRTADSLVKGLRKALPGKTKIYFIAAKPSKARWHLKEQYMEFNAALRTFTAQHKNVFFVDVWTPMIGSDGVVLQDIFIEDGLHMNSKGYEIWKEVIEPILK